MENLKESIIWVLENSKPINQEEKSELTKWFNYEFEAEIKVARIFWFISNTIAYLTKEDVDVFCKNHNLIYLDKEGKTVFVCNKKAKLSKSEICTLRNAVEKYSKDNQNFKWLDYFKEWKIDMRKNKFKYC